ncbi:MAG: hypothetical protein ACYTFT_05015, partial [Planctomycetota bacterium]
NKGTGWDRDLEYTIHFDVKGKLQVDHPQNNAMKCTWESTGKDYYFPRYIFRLKGLGGKGGNGNPEVKLDHLASLGVRLRGAFG